MIGEIEKSWSTVLATTLHSSSYTQLLSSVHDAYHRETVYPHAADVFRAFRLTPFSAVKVVIIGQDPYHGPGQADGLAFSVPAPLPIPPSLRNIYQELTNDLGTPPRTSGDLGSWAKAGVLLLNSSLTVRAGVAGSHRSLGWETFTDAVIKTVSNQKRHVVFLLWGEAARAKQTLINTETHFVLTSSHPSPLSAYRGFFGCRHFSQCNRYLEQHGRTPILW